MNNFSAFTCKANGILNQLRTKVYIHSDSCTQFPDKSNEWDALWDTGATNSCISHRIVSDLNLVPDGMKTMYSATHEVTVNTYTVDIMLPNKVTINDVLVSEMNLKDCDLLIGMDIIKYGDFSVTNFDGNTSFSFRIPSIKHIDYVEEANNMKKALKL